MTSRIDTPPDFEARHLGPDAADIETMLDALGYASIDALIDDVLPPAIRMDGELSIPEPLTEAELLVRLRELMSQNRVFRSYLGMGYSNTHTPGVILRNIMENPGWYTQYTPYQAEIAQGRLEALLNFQTAIIDLTGLEIANASLLDEGTAAAEAMHLAHGEARGDANLFFVSELCHPQTIDVVRTRAEPLGIEVVVGDHEAFELSDRVFGVLLQYPATDGRVFDYADFAARAHTLGATVVAACDLLSLALLQPPGAWGADVAIGNSQRFGVPLGFGGPHAAFMAARESFKRKLPGRIIGVSVDADGNRALRMALQTREQHIRRERATSNICTAQVLLAVMAGAYAVYHGPEGIRRIAERIRSLTAVLAAGLGLQGHELLTDVFFDTVRVRPAEDAGVVLSRALEAGINLRDFGDGTVGIALDEVTRPEDVDDLFRVFAGASALDFDARSLAERVGPPELPRWARRTSEYLTHEVFNRYRSETEMLRYLHQASRVSRPVAEHEHDPPRIVHDEAQCDEPDGRGHVAGSSMACTRSRRLIRRTRLPPTLRGARGVARRDQRVCRGRPLQPNSGAQGEYAGLLVIRSPTTTITAISPSRCLPDPRVGARHQPGERGHGRDEGRRHEESQKTARSIWTTWRRRHGSTRTGWPPSWSRTPRHTASSRRVSAQACDIVHEHGGLVYLDGANLNAQVGLARPGDYGADVCHINLHKTFAIPHGGGGPGMGPICVSEALAPYLPSHVVHSVGGDKPIGAVSAAPWGSASILVISWAYIAMLGRSGVRRASEVAILNANYMAKRLEGHFDILFRGEKGLVAHEFIVDLPTDAASNGHHRRGRGQAPSWTTASMRRRCRSR